MLQCTETQVIRADHILRFQWPNYLDTIELHKRCRVALLPLEGEPWNDENSRRVQNTVNFVIKDYYLKRLHPLDYEWRA